MATHIAYPDELLDDKKLNEFYYDVSTTCNDFSIKHDTLLNGYFGRANAFHR